MDFSVLWDILGRMLDGGGNLFLANRPSKVNAELAHLPAVVEQPVPERRCCPSLRF
jgi:hypothetical protein